jgi:hypothetical protein
MIPTRRRGAIRCLAALLAVLAVTGPLTGFAAANTATSATDADVDAGTVTAGNIAVIKVQLPDGTEAATLSLGESGSNFIANATVHDRDGDGSVAVVLDTAAAGNGNASSYLSARGPDELSAATQPTAAFDGGLDPLAYDVALVQSGDIVAEGTLFVEVDETDGNESATGSFDYEGDRLTLAAADRQTVRAETSLPPGTEVQVLLDATDADGVAWVTSRAGATVSEAGTVNATFDLAGYGPNVSFEARLVHEETVVTSAPGRLTACEQYCLRTDEVRVLGGVEVNQNRTAAIPVTFGDGDRLNVTVENTTGPAYRLAATVHDSDGDGRATLLFRTAHAGDEEPTLLVREDNETRPAELINESSLNRTIPAALYMVTARTPGERNAWDLGRLVVFESRLLPETATSASGGDEPRSTTDSVTPDPLDVQEDRGNVGLGLVSLGSIGVGGLIAVVGLTRLLR